MSAVAIKLAPVVPRAGIKALRKTAERKIDLYEKLHRLSSPRNIEDQDRLAIVAFEIANSLFRIGAEKDLAVGQEYMTRSLQHNPFAIGSNVLQMDFYIYQRNFAAASELTLTKAFTGILDNSRHRLDCVIAKLNRHQAIFSELAGDLDEAVIFNKAAFGITSRVCMADPKSPRNNIAFALSRAALQAFDQAEAAIERIPTSWDHLDIRTNTRNAILLARNSRTEFLRYVRKHNL